MESPVAFATLNLASWTVPNGEANAAFWERSTTGWRASNAARSWCPTSLDSSSNIRTPRPKGVPRPPSGLLRDATISRLAPAPAKRKQHPPAGTRRRDGANASDFLLPHQPCDPVNRPTHRHNVAASGAPPLDAIRTGDGRSQKQPRTASWPRTQVRSVRRSPTGVWSASTSIAATRRERRREARELGYSRDEGGEYRAPQVG